jgi:hypothetical protein
MTIWASRKLRIGHAVWTKHFDGLPGEDEGAQTGGKYVDYWM